jgi:hypothetical protein
MVGTGSIMGACGGCFTRLVEPPESWLVEQGSDWLKIVFDLQTRRIANHELLANRKS